MGRGRSRGGDGHAKLPKTVANLTDWMLQIYFLRNLIMDCHWPPTGLVSGQLYYRLRNDWVGAQGLASRNSFVEPRAYILRVILHRAANGIQPAGRVIALAVRNC